MRFTHALATVAIALVFLLSGCARNDAAQLTALYPQAAQRILAGQGFTRSGGGFVPVEPAAADPVKAAEASLTRRGGLRLQLPEHGSDAAKMTLPGGISIEVKERGLVGAVRPAGGALAYRRANGSSFWMVTDEGVEEWIQVDNAGVGPVAEWEVMGAGLRQDGNAVLVTDPAGMARARVTAPRAYLANGTEARAWLRVQGQVIALHTSARGAALVDPVWTTVGHMATARAGHTGTLLLSGKVLVAGGWSGITYAPSTLGSAELYDPATGTWSATGSLTRARSSHTATLLPSGKVLVAGGSSSGALASAELYDPAMGTWSTTGSLATARSSHTATPLPSGKVLVVGGTDTSWLASAEVYDPVAGTWSSTGSLATAREYHTATLLTSGKVLVAGGYNGAAYLDSSELYDPAAGTWSITAPLATSRHEHTATLLPSGKVLVAGGYSGGVQVGTAELYDPAAGTWSATGSLVKARQLHSATLLASGKVLVAGGVTGSNGDYAPVDGAEVYDPATGTWSASASFATARYWHTATLLPSGKVLAMGGLGWSNYLASAEQYDPAAGTWSATGWLWTAREFHTATLLPSGKVLVVGGVGSNYLTSAELYDPLGTWSTTGSLATARAHHTATLLPSGKVLVAGGNNTSVASAEVYDPATGAWSITGSLAAARDSHTATLLPSGKVLVAGGSHVSAYLASAEVYDPATGTWSTTGSLATARDHHTATLLSSGKVLVAGGQAGTTPFFVSAEVYDPTVGTWSATGSLLLDRAYHTATLLPSGKVLVVGGFGGSSAWLNTAELYDPAAGTWSTTGSLATGRERHTATLLPSGKVLVVGGYSGSYLASTELYDPAVGTWSVTGSLATARGLHTATLLSWGDVLVAGGYGGSYLASTELYDEGRGAQLEWTPVISVAPGWTAPGNSLNLFGSLFTGISEGSSGNTQSCATNFPLVQLRAADSGAVTFATVNAFDATSLTATVPASLPAGPYWVSVSVSGATSVAKPFTMLPPIVISPASVTITSRATQTFTASGGSGTGFTWSLATDASGASINASSGAYVAGNTGGVNDIVKVIDSNGASATATVTITALTISPGTSMLATGGRQTFTASGGSGAYAWSLASNASGASINASNGTYTAGMTDGVTDVVQVTDSLGNVATRSVTITTKISITSATTSTPPNGAINFGATGGSGAGLVWSLAASPSGSIISSGGVYRAGLTGGVTDVVQVVDSAGNVATQSITVTAGVSISPAMVSTPPKGSLTLTASGGSGIGFIWSLTAGPSGGTIGFGGDYTAGPTGGVTDIVQVVDSLGNVATRSVTVAADVSISPATASTPPKGSLTFTASGGSGTGFVWSLTASPSGGTISYGGVYTAGSTGGVTDVVEVVDSLGNLATRNVSVTAGVSITPTTTSTRPRSTINFGASGGSGGYTWSLSTNNSGGSITSAGGYTAGSTGGVTDTVKVTDSNGASATATVTVTTTASSGSKSGGCSQGPGGMMSLVGWLLAGAVRRRRRASPKLPRPRYSRRVYGISKRGEFMRRHGSIRSTASLVLLGLLAVACGSNATAPSHTRIEGTGTNALTSAAGTLAVLAGVPSGYGSAEGTGSAARFNLPSGVAVDGSGNVYVADTGNNTIRKVTPAGAVTTLAGAAGTSGSADGTGSAARFNWPHGVAVDGSGNVYVADSSNDTIRKITPSGVVTTIAGSAGQTGSADGTGAAARFNLPSGVAVDGSGNVYVAESNNNTIRKPVSSSLERCRARRSRGWTSPWAAW